MMEVVPQDLEFVVSVSWFFKSFSRLHENLVKMKEAPKQRLLMGQQSLLLPTIPLETS